MIKILNKIKINIFSNLRQKINLFIYKNENQYHHWFSFLNNKLIAGFAAFPLVFPFFGFGKPKPVDALELGKFLTDKSRRGDFSREDFENFIKYTDWANLLNDSTKFNGNRFSYKNFYQSVIEHYDTGTSVEALWIEAQKHYPVLTSQEKKQFKEMLSKLHNIVQTRGYMLDKKSLKDIDYFFSIDDKISKLKVEMEENGTESLKVSKLEALYRTHIEYISNFKPYLEQAWGKRRSVINENDFGREYFAQEIAPDLLRLLVDPWRFCKIKNDPKFRPDQINIILKHSGKEASMDSILGSVEGDLVDLKSVSMRIPSVVEEKFDYFNLDLNLFEKIYLNFKDIDFKTELDPGLLYLDFLDKWRYISSSDLFETFFFWKGEYFFLISFIGLVLFYSKRPHFKVEYGLSYILAPIALLFYASIWSIYSQIEIFFYRQHKLFNEYKEFFFNEYFVHPYGFSSGNGYFNNLFVIDNYTIFIKIFISLSLILFLWAMSLNLYNSFENKNYSQFSNLKSGLFSLFTDFNLNTKGEFYRNFLILLPITVFFLLFLVSCNNFLSLFVSLEGATLCLYILAGIRTDNRLSVEGSLKYFLISALFSCVFGAGVFLLYLITGSLDFLTIREIIRSILTEHNIWSFYGVDYLLNISIIMITVVFLMKLGGAPYQYWIGDVYQGSPLIITTFFATIVRIGFFAIFLKLVCNVFIYMQYIEVYSNILYLSGFFSILIGSFLALSQTEIKRFLAYSSIVHTGFILIGISTMSFDGFKSSLLYMIIYIITLMGFMLCLIIYKSQIVQNIFNKSILKIKNTNFFSDLQCIPIGSQMVLVIFLFSMAGLPPFPGFLIKLYIFKDYILNLFYDAIQYNLYFNISTCYQFFGFFSFVIIVLISILTGFNYIRLITGSLFMIPSFINDKPIFSSINFNKLSKIFNNLIVCFILFSNFILIFYIPSFYYSDYFNTIISSLTFSMPEVFILYPSRFGII